MTRTRILLAVALPLGLAGCAYPPVTGPTVYAMPPQGKSLQAFQADDLNCRGYAQAAIGGTGGQRQQTNAAIGSAAAGTALGAAAGALLGAAGGNAGTGAAVGAGVGLLTGSAIGANQANAVGYGAQQRYDVAYSQCMVSNGDNVVPPAPPVVVGYPSYYGYPAPYWGPAIGFGYYGGWGGYRGGWYGRRW